MQISFAAKSPVFDYVARLMNNQRTRPSTPSASRPATPK